MKFSVGTNFDPTLVSQISHMNVYEVHGKMTSDVIGGGRPSFYLGNIYKKQLKAEVTRAHKNNIEFNYLLNAAATGNVELSRSGMKKIIKLLDLLERLEVDTITVALPYLAKFIKRNYPQIKIDVSTISSVHNTKQVEQWLDLGINTITLDDTSANRDFRFLEKIVSMKACEVKLMVNLACYPSCIHKQHHYSTFAINSQNNSHFPISFYMPQCKQTRILDLKTHLTGGWIRPEDLHVYTDLGINKFKVIHRHDPTELIIKILTAYYNQRYDGNLLDIVKFSYQTGDKNKKSKMNLFKMFKYLFKPSVVNPFKLLKFSKLLNDDYELYIDNNKLDGFIDFFKTGKCQELTCSTCDHCDLFTKKAIQYNEEKRQDLIKRTDKMLQYFIDKNNLIF